jgi:RNA 2',3'-cyclic 3'-phosphodiesterase
VALDLPEDAREALVRWREKALGGRAELRLLAPEALHVTLVFLGYLVEDAIPRIAELIEPPPIEAPVLAATGVKPIPPRGPRLFALDLEDEDGRCGQIQATVSDALESAGLYEPEKRPFWPHVTLARVRKGERVRELDPPAPPAQPWRGAAVTLYRSRLSRAGARYEALTRLPL